MPTAMVSINGTERNTRISWAFPGKTDRCWLWFTVIHAIP